MTNVAKAVRLSKEAHPGRYCPSPKCLWNLINGPCPKHQVTITDRRSALLAQGFCPGCAHVLPAHNYYCREDSTAKLPAVRKRCQNCGDYEDVVGDGTCTTFEKDVGNPFGKIPILGVHEWFEEKT